MHVVRPLAALIPVLALLTAAPAPGQNLAAHIYIGYVMTAWKEVPDGRGLLPVAENRAKAALAAARKAADRPGDRNWVRRHLGDVLAQVDPDTGFGVIRAAMGIKIHIELAAATADATPAVKLHAEKVAASAANVARWSERVARLCRQVIDAGPADDPTGPVRLIAELSKRMVDGVDADGDGRILGGDEEGGLKQVRRYMTFMMRAEGLR